MTPHTRAGKFIYLNRTCWNGLYRVNLAGQFNVPLGTKTAVCLSTDDFEATAKALKNMKLITSDFEPVIAQAGTDDFLFIDPPYTVKHNMNGFVKYNETIFSWEDQVRLKDAITAASKRGAKILITNADHDSIRELYTRIGLKFSLPRHSVLAASSSKRGPTSELAIAINYHPTDEAISSNI